MFGVRDFLPVFAFTALAVAMAKSTEPVLLGRANELWQ